MSAKPKTAALPALPALHPKRLCLVLRRLVRWLREYRFTLATITITITRDTTPDRSPDSPAERDLRETAQGLHLDVLRLLSRLADGGLGLNLGPSGGLASHPRCSRAGSGSSPASRAAAAGVPGALHRFGENGALGEAP